jgi:CDP-diacylglycerol--inositol 3-phosphatidyltransferase
LNKYWSKPLQHSLNIPEGWLDALVQVSPELFKWTSWLVKNVTWPQLVGAVTFPICAGKQIINVVQFWKASKIVSYLGKKTAQDRGMSGMWGRSVA